MITRVLKLWRQAERVEFVQRREEKRERREEKRREEKKRREEREEKRREEKRREEREKRREEKRREGSRKTLEPLPVPKKVYKRAGEGLLSRITVELTIN
ncbi:hypothetical protein DUI87_16962 [Hirundo rustica rustica]|uniref:Uncharacterized protein n=1 Tax=Hirundo rustica rustica TaxID=333673 RepID=A0A3M0K367_HIRRU|nr:hypothetical protein DUI87_16962 [Hirundo rustica rustica]